MKHIFTSLLIFFSFLSFSQVITFECDNQIITVSVDEISNNPNTYIDWDGDGDIDEDDALIYLFEAYDCNDEDDNSNGDDDEENDWGDVFTFECNGEEITIELTNINDFINYESYIDSILSDYDCEEWLDNEENDWGDNNEENDWNVSDIDWNVSDWEDFNWDIYWDEFDLNDIDWENIIWDIIIELDISPEDFIDYITSIIAEGQPFNWENFFNAQGCIDDDAAIVGGLSGIGIEVAGCSDAVPYLMSIGYSCSDQLTIPGLGSIMPSDVCCETCEGSSGGGDDVMGCTDSSACNYNIEATVNDGSCEYGVQCLVSPCSVSENPGVDGAYCVDDYCNWGSCCALWYDFSGNLISNSCEEEEGCIDDDAAAVALASMWNPDILGCEDAIPYLQAAGYPCDTDLSVLGMSGTIADICECSCDEVVEPEDNFLIGLWYDTDSDQYVEITENEIGFYSFLDEDYFMCWYYWSMEYIYLGDGLVEVMDPEDGPDQIQADILENGDLQITDPEGDVIILSSLDDIPELDMCDFPSNEGCEAFEGQWVYVFPNSEMEVLWMEIDEFGVDFFILGDDLCVDYIYLSYDSIEGSDDCTLFVDAYGGQFEFGQLSLNADGTLSFVDMPDFPEDWPTVWSPGDFDSEEFMICSYGCTDPSACNFDPFSNVDNGTCGLIDDCGDCQVPYCYSMIDNTVEYVSESECDGLWIGNDCENNEYCLSSPMNPYWNAGCLSIDENSIDNKIQLITNLLGQTINPNNTSGVKLYFYQNGNVQKQQIIK